MDHEVSKILQNDPVAIPIEGWLWLRLTEDIEVHRSAFVNSDREELLGRRGSMLNEGSVRFATFSCLLFLIFLNSLTEFSKNRNFRFVNSEQSFHKHTLCPEMRDFRVIP